MLVMIMMDVYAMLIGVASPFIRSKSFSSFGLDRWCRMRTEATKLRNVVTTE